MHQLLQWGWGFFLFGMLFSVGRAAPGPDSLKFEQYSDALPRLIRTDVDSAFLVLQAQKALLDQGDLRDSERRDFLPRLMNGFGIYFRRIGQLDSAQLYYEKASAVQDSAKNPARKAILFNNIANIHFQKGEYPIALDYHFRALSIRRQLESLPEVAMSLANIGLVYENLSEHKKAAEYYEKCLKISRETRDSVKIGWTLTSLGTLALTEGKLPLAEDYLRKSIAVKSALGDANGVSLSRTNLGAVFLKKAKLDHSRAWVDSAFKHLGLAQQSQIEMDNHYGQVATLTYLGETCLWIKQPLVARDMLQNAVSLAKAHGYDQERARALELLSETAAQLGQYKLALEWFQAFKALNDTLFNQEKDKEIGRKEAWFTFQQQLTEKELRFEADREVAKIDQKRKNLWLAVIGLSLVLMVMLVIWVVGKWRKAGKARKIAENRLVLVSEEKRQIEEKNAELQGRIKTIQAKLEDKKEPLPAHLEQLTKREMEVLLLLGIGLTDKEIAERLFISPATVRTHNRKIFEKLGLKNRTEASEMMHRYKLV